jgi:hypothetical protein
MKAPESTVAEIRDCGTAFILANYIVNVEKIPPKQLIADKRGINSWFE